MLPICFSLLTALQFGPDPTAAVADGAAAHPQPATGRSTFWWGDFDSDGLPDAWVVRAGGSGRLLRNTGNGQFEDVTERAGLGDVHGVHTALWADYDADRRLDVYLLSWEGPSRLMQQTPQGTFVDASLDAGVGEHRAVVDARWIDYDADGRFDLHLTTVFEEILFHNLGNGGFEKVYLDLPSSVPFERSGAFPGSLDEARRQRGLPAAPPAGSMEMLATGLTAQPSGSHALAAGTSCFFSIEDFANAGACINASSVPTLGMLHPISTELFVDASTGRVGMGNTNPATQLDVSGTVRSRSGGFQFPDGTTQTTATLVGPEGPAGPQGPQGDPGPPGTPGDSHWSTSGSTTYYNSGNVGVGTSSPSHRLHVATSSSANAVFGENSFSGAGVFGHQTATSGIRDGVGGRSDSTAGRGVFGWATSSFGNAYGVQGQSDSSSGRGVYARASSTSGTTYGVYGETNSASGFGGYFVGPVGSQNYFQRSVGIGTTSPANPLSVVGGADISGQVSIGITGADARLLVRGTTGEDAFRVRVETASKLVVKDNGGVAVGSNYGSVPTNGMRIAGNLGVAGADPAGFELAVNGDAAKPGGGLWSVYSDARLKHDIEPLEPGTLERLLALRGYTFEYDRRVVDAGLALPGTQVGLIAQEVEKVFPEWVDTDDDGHLYVTERGLTAILVEALRELRAGQDADIGRLARENALLKQRLERLEALVIEGR